MVRVIEHAGALYVGMLIVDGETDPIELLVRAIDPQDGDIAEAIHAVGAAATTEPDLIVAAASDPVPEAPADERARTVGAARSGGSALRQLAHGRSATAQDLAHHLASTATTERLLEQTLVAVRMAVAP